MECDPTRVCELLVGLGDVEVLGVDDAAEGPLWSKGERSVELMDLPAFGRPVRLV